MGQDASDLIGIGTLRVEDTRIATNVDLVCRVTLESSCETLRIDGVGTSTLVRAREVGSAISDGDNV